MKKNNDKGRRVSNFQYWCDVLYGCPLKLKNILFPNMLILILGQRTANFNRRAAMYDY